MLKVEPMPRFKREDGEGYTVSTDVLGEVAPIGWEQAHLWPGLGTVMRFCQACKSLKLQVKRSKGLVVTTCTCVSKHCRHTEQRGEHCNYAHADAAATKACIVRAQEDWVRRGLARIETDDQGKPIGVHMPTHSDVDNAESLAKMVQSGEVPS